MYFVIITSEGSLSDVWGPYQTQAIALSVCPTFGHADRHAYVDQLEQLSGDTLTMALQALRDHIEDLHNMPDWEQAVYEARL